MVKAGLDDHVVETGATASDVNGLPRVETWPQLAPETLYGLAGRVVEAVDPHTEADPVATLVTFLADFGNLIGPGPHASAGRDDHPGRLYVTLVGTSSKARTGLSRANPCTCCAPSMVCGPRHASRPA